jgi:hypothetical protein
MRAVYPRQQPDFARALALVGPTHRVATLFCCTPPACALCAATVAIVTRDLARIGITVHAKFLDNALLEASKPHARWDLFLYTFFADYADPSNFVNNLFDPASPAPLHPYNDPRYVAGMRAAYYVTGRKRASKYRMLATDMMRDSPPTAQYAFARQPPQIFSRRVGCQVFRPQDGGLVDLAALCLK